MVIDGVEVVEDGSSGDLAADLIIRVADGDQRAFAELYDLLSPRVFALILKVVVNRSQSEEVLQEVFLEIWQSASKFAPNRGQGRSWIFTIAHRRAVDRVRSSQSSTDRDMRVGVRDLGGERDVVQEAVESKLEGERVVAALSALPEAQQEALILAYYGGYSQSEIAALTGVALGTIKTRMRDGLTRLRGEMGVSAA
ncbi:MULTISPECIES: ECF RNA polymerase sigma factor SigK [unclassified Microbacterium]|uniref:ECF RNA polymerase sigma factor SigK n=1 Tax=unclassified Microbacterium TaxID=2609290 RepID=UPI0008FCBC9B|nr:MULTISPECIES: ECF RNA polymerase sigma factor SigK [unclassified Microbacterium]OIU87831.1 RNA polymerase subunit sigma [Microbacterium sp. AR7-10]